VLASAAYLDGLQRFYREHLAIDVEVMRPLEPDRSAWDSARQQWMGERLIEQLARVSGTNDAVVIGVLGDDMYVLSENWRYAFAMRSDDNRLAIVSYARMNPLFWGEPRDADRLQLRLRKMVTKELGLMRFGLPASSNPESPMYGNIGGVEDLDLMHDDPIEGGFPTRS
jgi:predicted Zn-dependent protease